MRLVSTWPVSCAALLLLCVLIGCDHARDVTKYDRVRAGGIVGQCYELQQDAEIVRHGRRPPYLSLRVRSVVPDTGTDIGTEIVGVADHGTQIQVEKVVLFNYGWLPTPALAPSDIPITLARVLDGPHVGRQISTNGLGLDAYSPGVNDAFFRPSTRPAEGAD